MDDHDSSVFFSGGLNENDLPRLVYLNTWLSDGRDANWEGLAGVTIKEEGLTLRFEKSGYLPVSPLCLIPVDQDVSSQLLLQNHAYCHVPHCNSGGF